MRALADQKTGRLFIPGRGWIKARTIQQRAGMCARTRKKYMAELIRLGAVHLERERVNRRIGGRLRSVRGCSCYTVLPFKPPNTNSHASSSTVQTSQNAESSLQDSVSSTVHFSTEHEKPPSTVQFLHRARIAPTNLVSKAPLSAAGVGSGSSFGSPPVRESFCKHLSQESPALREEFYRWCDKIVLDRAYDGVRDKVAFLTVARRQFLADLHIEVASWLEQPAKEFYDDAFLKNPFGEVDRQQCREFLLDAAKAKLPDIAQRVVTAQMIANAEQAAVEERKLLVGATGDSCVHPHPEKWQKIKDEYATRKARK